MATLKKKEKDELDRLNNIPTLEQDPFPDEHGVLLSDKITILARDHNLVFPFDEENLKPAAYELTLGNEYYLNGQFNSLKGAPDKITIKPFDVAVVKTAETICLPRFLIARWNLRVRYTYQGLLWIGASQVDPGYKGHLFCPIYNLSNKGVDLFLGDSIAQIDFVKTTHFNYFSSSHANSHRYPVTTRPIIENFDVENRKSALLTELSLKIDEFDNSISLIQNRIATYITITFAVLALIISTLAVMFRLKDSSFEITHPSYWVTGLIIISLLALFMSVPQYFSSRRDQYRKLKGVAAIGASVLIVGFVIFEIISERTDTYIEKLDTKIENVIIKDNQYRKSIENRIKELENITNPKPQK